MRIVQLTPGTGNFHCGSCLRDNALVHALRARGHDVLMVPLYSPVVLDEPSACDGVPVFLGGINLYLREKFSFFAGANWLSSPRLLHAAARLHEMTTAKDLGQLTLSMLRGETRELEKLLAWLQSQPKPDVICLSNSLLAGMARRLKEQFRVPVVCTLQGEDLFLDSLTESYRAPAWELLAQRCADIDHFIAVSQYFGDRMRERLGLKAEQISVVYAGIPAAECAPAPPNPPVVGYLARMHHAKGLGTLVDAFRQLNVPGVRLRVAGAMTGSDKPFVRSLRRKLGPAAEFLPNLGRQAKYEFLRGLSVFSVPATYGEAFGLYVLEALACGVPVVQPRHGAFPELLAQTRGGVLCEPDNPSALATALRQLLLNPDRARQLGAAGRKAVQEKFTVEAMAQKTEAVFLKVTHAA